MMKVTEKELVNLIKSYGGSPGRALVELMHMRRVIGNLIADWKDDLEYLNHNRPESEVLLGCINDVEKLIDTEA